MVSGELLVLDTASGEPVSRVEHFFDLKAFMTTPTPRRSSDTTPERRSLPPPSCRTGDG